MTMSTSNLKYTRDPMQECDLILLEAHIHKEHLLRGGTSGNTHWRLLLLIAMLIVCIVLAATSVQFVGPPERELEGHTPDVGFLGRMLYFKADT
jgi:hypothetical protein